MADSRIDQLTEDTAPALTDLVYVEHDPGGTPVNRRVQIGNLPFVRAARYMVGTAAQRAALAPVVGDTFFETDTGNYLQYQSATTGWTPPWNTAWGILGAVSKTTDQTGITTVADVSTLTITVTVVANRRIRTTGQGLLTSTVVADVVVGYITDGSNAAKQRWGQVIQVGSGGLSQMERASVLETPSAGSFTRKLRAERNAGTGSVSVLANAAYPASIEMEDVGPSAAPA